MILSKDTINIFKELGLFDKVNNETLSRLNDICYIRELKKNEHLFRDKEIINSI